MANYLLLPGFGGQAVETIEADESDASEGVDGNVYDCSLVDNLAIQVKSLDGVGSIQAYQSFDNVNWEPLGSPLTTVGGLLKLDITDRPFGLVKLNLVAEDDSAGSLDSSSALISDVDNTVAVVTITGWNTKVKS